jgi:hypothetical protein
VERLARRVDILEQLPDRVSALESQIVQLRDEMRSEFSATRKRDEETRRVLTERMESLFEANERHMRLLHEDLVQRIATIREERS